MTNTGHQKYAVILLILALFVCGCGQDSPISGKSAAPVAIDLDFAPNAAMQENITDIEIVVLNSDSGEIVEAKLVNINNTSREGQFIEASIQMPVGIPLNLTVTAFESNCPIFEFNEDVEIDPNEDDPIIIPVELLPFQMVFGMNSEQDRINPGDTYVLNIYVQDASRLVSFVCEINFDEDLMELLEIETGEMLADKIGLLSLADYLDIEENSSSPIALGFTERADIGEKICGSGSIFRLSFRAKTTGTAHFEILNDSFEVWAIKDNEFAEIGDSEQVKIVTEHSVIIE